MSPPAGRQFAAMKAEAERCFDQGTSLSLYWVPSVLRLIEQVEQECCSEGEGVIGGKRVRLKYVRHTSGDGATRTVVPASTNLYSAIPIEETDHG